MEKFLNGEIDNNENTGQETDKVQKIMNWLDRATKKVSKANAKLQEILEEREKKRQEEENKKKENT